MREWSKRTYFSFRSSLGCSNQNLDIFISLNLSFHDKEAGIFDNSLAQKLATPERFLWSLFLLKSSKLQFCRRWQHCEFLSYQKIKNTSVFVLKRQN